MPDRLGKLLAQPREFLIKYVRFCGAHSPLIPPSSIAFAFKTGAPVPVRLLGVIYLPSTCLSSSSMAYFFSAEGQLFSL